ncbi:hypothetical protein DFH94DRAFT_704549 [Russula ochroleuca]|uniref:Uncharacterized protein n=1 Tax=Russula ochroleuca TaxID=152965 RepID=A0A9P5TDZ7_9AGAM|nr:hypothetical protein DFH94DRAFT_704549 [Russula ochroleuca]
MVNAFPSQRSPSFSLFLVVRMVNFHDPAVVAKDNFVLLKLWHVVDGIFLWEFFTNLDFEWSFIRRRRRYRWTIWIYSLSRLATLAAVISNLVLLNLDTSPNCSFSTPVIFASFSAYLALAAASLLLVIRVIAIWNRNKVVIVVATTMWAINGAFFIQGISQFRYVGDHCKALSVEASKITMIVSFLTDVFLLIIMLVGLFRLDCHRHGALATGRFLWNQV